MVLFFCFPDQTLSPTLKDIQPITALLTFVREKVEPWIQNCVSTIASSIYPIYSGLDAQQSVAERQ